MKSKIKCRCGGEYVATERRDAAVFNADDSIGFGDVARSWEVHCSECDLIPTNEVYHKISRTFKWHNELHVPEPKLPNPMERAKTLLSDLSDISKDPDPTMACVLKVIEKYLTTEQAEVLDQINLVLRMMDHGLLSDEEELSLYERILNATHNS